MYLSLDPLLNLILWHAIWREWIFENILTFKINSKKFLTCFELFKYQKWYAEFDIRAYSNSMLLPNRMLFGSPFSNVKVPEKIPSVTLNVFSKTLSEV